VPRRLTLVALIIVNLSFLPSSINAQSTTDELGACLVRSSSAVDKELLTTWMFAAMTAHPSVAELMTISSVQMTEINVGVAALFTNLLAYRCETEVVTAITDGGLEAVENSFSTLGEVAMVELMSHPIVEAQIGGFTAYLDMDALSGIVPQ